MEPIQSLQAVARRRQRIEALCAASIRALTGEPDLHFRAQRLHRGTQPLPAYAAHLSLPVDAEDFASFRGVADGLALRLTRSDDALHQRLCPGDPLERMLFNLLEQFRVEALAPADLPGMLRNLRHRHQRWSLQMHHAGATETADGLLLYAVAQVCRARVTAQPVTEETEGLIEATRMAMAPLLGHHIAALRGARFEQAAYARHALALAHAVAQTVLQAQEPGGRHDGRTRGLNKHARPNLWLKAEPAGDDPVAAPASDRNRVPDEADGGYRIHTTAYDRELGAGSLVRPAQLRDLRRQLDLRIAAQALNVARLARRLTALLARPARAGWDDAQEEGLVDGRRLAQLVASPSERRLFRREREAPASDCVVSFLIDCSGSMRQHIESVAMLADVFARALEQAGAASEVLGFTTGSWNGGRARSDWLRAGRPRHPGRLNERCHLVFKDADTSWRRARPAIAALLKADLFREGIDGEAVEWACRRLEQRPEARRLLLVVSDGSPMDGATELANDAHYLDRHLRAVVAQREAGGTVEIFGLGVGLDLSASYRRSRVLGLSGSLGNAVLHEVAGLLAGQRRAGIAG